MSAYVVLPDLRRDTAQPSTTTSVVLCGAVSAIREVARAASLTGTRTTVLSSAADVRAYSDANAAPDVCVIVTPLSDGPAVPLIRMLRTRGWQKVLVLSGKADARAIHATLSCGVRSVIIHRPDEVAAPTAPPTGAAHLSDRELEVLRMVADGRTNRAVGERLGLSALTVKSHLARIARKLGSGDRAQMVATAIRAGYMA
jgi:DNA-binding NarL/FixJ family response regulator